MQIEVAYARSPTEQIIIAVEVAAHCSVATAIERSGILQRCVEIDIAHCSVGIFSQRATLNTLLHAGDRIEIYRPLLIDPKQARRARAKKTQKDLK